MATDRDLQFAEKKCTRYLQSNRTFLPIIFKLLKEERLQGATLLVLANKQDLVGAATHDEIRQLLKLGETALNSFFNINFKDDIKTHHWCIEPISATKDEVEKLQKSFGWLVDDISSRVFTMD